MRSGKMAKPNAETITDLTAGLYRRQFSGFIRGRRINSVTLDTEAWFWRFHGAADDFGNAEADEIVAYTNTIGRRKGITPAKVQEFLHACEAVDLLRIYVIGEESFYHIVGWSSKQPKGKNGKRVRRVPASPWDDNDDPKAPENLFQVNPDSSSASHSHSHSHSHDQDLGLLPQTASAAMASTPTPAATADDPKAILVFPTVCSRRSRENEWALTQDVLDEFSETYTLDVLLECKKAMQWVKADRKHRKTHGGMRAFLVNWLNRAQNQGGGNGQSHSPRMTKAQELQDRVQRVNAAPIGSFLPK